MMCHQKLQEDICRRGNAVTGNSNTARRKNCKDECAASTMHTNFRDTSISGGSRERAEDRVMDGDGVLSVTHTVQGARRLTDLISVPDLLLTLPALQEPSLRPLAFEHDFYDQWARASRSDTTARSSVRPGTIPAKGSSVLQAVPASTSSSQPAGPTNTLSNSEDSPAKASSLDNIIEHYNTLFPPVPHTGSQQSQRTPSPSRFAQGKRSPLPARLNSQPNLLDNFTGAKENRKIAITLTDTSVANGSIKTEQQTMKYNIQEDLSKINSHRHEVEFQGNLSAHRMDISQSADMLNARNSHSYDGQNHDHHSSVPPTLDRKSISALLSREELSVFLNNAEPTSISPGPTSGPSGDEDIYLQVPSHRRFASAIWPPPIDQSGSPLHSVRSTQKASGTLLENGATAKSISNDNIVDNAICPSQHGKVPKHQTKSKRPIICSTMLIDSHINNETMLRFNEITSRKSGGGFEIVPSSSRSSPSAPVSRSAQYRPSSLSDEQLSNGVDAESSRSLVTLSDHSRGMSNTSSGSDLSSPTSALEGFFPPIDRERISPQVVDNSFNVVVSSEIATVRSTEDNKGSSLPVHTIHVPYGDEDLSREDQNSHKRRRNSDIKGFVGSNKRSTKSRNVSKSTVKNKTLSKLLETDAKSNKDTGPETASSRGGKHRKRTLPCVQFMDLSDLKAIFAQAAKDRKFSMVSKGAVPPWGFST